jgi:outer membrane protein
MLLSEAAAAQTRCKSPSPECVAVGEWDISVSLGAGGRTNPIRGNSDIPLIVIPQISYYGERFFLDSLELGFTLHENDTHTFNLVATPGYDRVFFFSNDLQNLFVRGAGGLVLTGELIEGSDDVRAVPVPRRHTTYLVGPEWIFRYGRLIGQLDGLYEATGRHHGHEVRAAVATPIIASKDSLVMSLGLTFKSAELVRYYYGIEGLYEPGSALNPFLKLGYSRPVSERVGFNAFVHYEFLDDSVSDSPLVSSSGVATVFAGWVFKIL